MPDSDSSKVAAYCEQHLKLDSLELGEEYFYQSLPLCVVDSVFSIGVKFKAVQNTVARCCNYLGEKNFREYGTYYPPLEDQMSIKIFLSKLENFREFQLADRIFGNRQRTSSTNGILKAEAVRQFAQVLRKHKINYFSDVECILKDSAKLDALEKDIQKIPGQTSGISTTYFFMLAGSDDKIKPDRMILRFLEHVLDRPKKSVGLKEAQNLVLEAVVHLKPAHPDLNARLLDYGIWSFQRQQPKGSTK